MHMTENQKIAQILSSLPDEPGVYQMLDSGGKIIYIGKANSLKKRVTSYFTKKDHDPKTTVLVKNIRDIEYIITDSEIEALLLESTLIKKHKPKFNVRLKDDKRYPYIAVTLNEDYPRVIYTRSINRNKDRYFGPFTDARAAKNTSIMINNLFRLKTCRRQIPLRENERPCINYQIGKCSGVCDGKISQQEYRALVDDAVSFLEGNIEPVIENLNFRMKAYSASMDFEKAAAMRDMIFDIQTVSQKQKVDLASGLNQDYMSVKITGGEALLVLFEFRRGVLTGRRVNVFDNAEYTDEGTVFSAFIVEYYRAREIPSRIMTPVNVPDTKILAAHLSELAGTKVIITTAASKQDQAIISLINKNIDIITAERRLSEQSNPVAGLAALKDSLELETEPEVMECFDISNLQGTDAVASMVSFRDGRPDKSGYRRYKIRGYDAADDPGMIHEVVSRRIQYLV
ncbi:MAG TPA: excinuclease ABC subunit UvrC, partial [Spirochaetota bacterium]|nr:excinuclease ABC subunit UvrC [Spirochaetota bacterium]